MRISDWSSDVCSSDLGKQLTSRAFAERLGRWQDDGIPDVAFLTGGADGLSEPVRQAADAILSLGRLTWPHMLVRGLLAEQLFRAESILAGQDRKSTRLNSSH